MLAYLHDQQTKLGLPLQLSDEVQSRDDAGVPGSNTAFLWERVSSWLFCRKRVTCKILPFVSSWSTTNFIAFEPKPRNGDGLVVYAHPLPSSHPPPRLLCNGMLRRLLPSLLPSHPGAEFLRSPRAHSSRSSLCRGVHWLCREREAPRADWHKEEGSAEEKERCYARLDGIKLRPPRVHHAAASSSIVTSHGRARFIRRSHLERKRRA